MHTVTLNPSAVTITPGGSAQTVIATITGVPPDTNHVQALDFFVGSVPVTANLTVTVDNPQPTVSGDPADPVYTLSFATPVQDPSEPSTWACEITITPV